MKTLPAPALAALWIFFIVLMPSAATAERVVNLREAVSLALEGNHGLRAMGRSVMAGREEIGMARSEFLPRVSFEERYMRTNNPTAAFSSKLNQQRFEQPDFLLDNLNEPDDIGDFQTMLSLEQPIYARPAHVGLAMAKKNAQAMGLELKRQRETVALGVVRAYMEVRTAREFVHAGRKGLDEAREHRRIAGARFKAGLGLYSDTLRTDVFVNEAEEELIRAEKNHRVAKRSLGLIMGLDEPVDIRGDGEPGLLREVDFYLEAAMKRSDLEAVRVRLQNAGNAVKLAEAKYFPTFGLGGSYQFNDPDSPFGTEGDSYRLTAFLRWNVFDGTLRRHERAKAKFREQEAGEFLEGLTKKVRFSVHEAYLGVEWARRSLELARSREALAEENKRLVSERYANSLATVVELLDVQVSLDAARADVAMKFGKYLTALAELKFQSGLLLEDYSAGQ